MLTTQFFDDAYATSFARGVDKDITVSGQTHSVKTETIGNATAAPGDEAAFGPVDCDVILRSGLARFMFEPKKEH